MTERPKTAYITGGASGMGLALATHLLLQNYRVFIADRNTAGAIDLASKHNTSTNITVYYAVCDTSSWESQLSTFQAALKALGGRISCIFPIAGIVEKKWLPFPAENNDMPADEFAKPDLSVVDIDLTGVLYTVALAVQHFRRQDLVVWNVDDGSEEKFLRGTIGLVASVCGFYCVPSLPIYTAAKHALVGLTKSYGALLKEEGITINAVAPNVVRTGFITKHFSDRLDKEGLLTPIHAVVAAFDDMLRGGKSGLVYECGPKGGWTLRDGVTYLDEESARCCDLLNERGMMFHYGLK
ncbi:hypothetical protein G6011_06201 [Alternaria panax]|uniref:NAD(P)-binding protein n=1 Tax=Alternaria panax TaxID=48097 RepID=A0AAD4FI14_9PLEO|nr:hypothetical protein G6011_06201 [Alternaria panax]